MKVSAEFVTSAAGAADFPRDGLPEVALIGRSNVGKSALINALVRQRVARTSATPGKTRLANVYRVARGGSPPLYLVDLPGYGYARGGSAGFEELVTALFAPARLEAEAGGDRPVRPEPGALLVVDARHPGLDNDRGAWRWMTETIARRAIVATKIDKLARAERIRAVGQLESVLEHSVLPVSAVTGEGLEELWKLIDNLANNSRNSSPLLNRRPRAPGEAAPPSRKRTSRPRRS